MAPSSPLTVLQHFFFNIHLKDLYTGNPNIIKAAINFHTAILSSVPLVGDKRTFLIRQVYHA